MKTGYFYLMVIALVSPSLLQAQSPAECENHPVFNTMPHHKVNNCDKKEYEEVEFYQKIGDKDATPIKKSGNYINVSYSFEGAWESRPSATQIYQNYINATTSAGGQVLYKSASQVHLSIKKAGDLYWVKVIADGSGSYWVTSVKEAAMRQDIVMTADLIKKGALQEGKVAFYGIYFETGKATLKNESGATIAEIAKYLKENPATNVFIVGHTDNVGTYESNLTLSLDRAGAVVDQLVKIHSISQGRLQAVGVGSVAPVSANSTEEGKAKNRRVEMVLR